MLQCFHLWSAGSLNAEPKGASAQGRLSLLPELSHTVFLTLQTLLSFYTPIENA